MLLPVWRFALALVATTRLAFADSGSAAPPAEQTQTVQHHGLGIVFVLVTAVGLLILSKVLPRSSSKKPDSKDSR